MEEELSFKNATITMYIDRKPIGNATDISAKVSEGGINVAKALELKTTGIQCDNPKCDYKNKDLPFEEWHKWINKPCPKCGQNLLTEKDYESAKALVSMVNVLNEILPENEKDKKGEAVSVKIGNGEINIKTGVNK